MKLLCGPAEMMHFSIIKKTTKVIKVLFHIFKKQKRKKKNSCLQDLFNSVKTLFNLETVSLHEFVVNFWD